MTSNSVYIVDAKRSPHAKAGTDLKKVAPPFLAAYLVRHILDKTSIPDDEVDEVIFGSVGNPSDYPNLGRVIALEAGLHKKTSGYTVHRNCASGMEALAQGFLKIASGRSQVLAVGGTESMSQMPLIYSVQMTELFVGLMRAKSVVQKLKALSRFRPSYLAPIVAIEQGLKDPFCGLNMGQTAEVLSRELGIDRQEQDQLANRSHQLAVKAQKEGRFRDEIVPLPVGKELSKPLDRDIGPRQSSSVEKLAKMRPYFERKSGTVTVGNSCPLTDGGSALLLASEEALKRYNLTPMARIVDYHFHGLEPKRMGMGPLLASHGVFARTGMKVDQMDLVEVNEAFAAQALAVCKGFKEKEVARRFGLDEALGEIPDEKFNVNGGAIALGHPIGSTGSRLVVTLAHELKKRGATYGLASLCIGGGQGGAMIVENLEK